MSRIYASFKLEFLPKISDNDQVRGLPTGWDGSYFGLISYQAGFQKPVKHRRLPLVVFSNDKTVNSIITALVIGIRKGKWKLDRLPDRIPLLFNLDNDPSEQDNIALENLDLVKSMLKELGDWDVSTPHILFLEGARWRRNQLDLYDKQYQLEQP